MVVCTGSRQPRDATSTAWVSLHCHLQHRVILTQESMQFPCIISFLHPNPPYIPPSPFPAPPPPPPRLCVSGTYTSTGVIKCRVACGVHASVLSQRKDFLQEKNDHFQYFAGCPSKPIIAWHLHTKGKDPANL